jgi:hypothetical protein
MPDDTARIDLPHTTDASAVTAALAQLDRSAPPGEQLARLIAAGLDRLPLPGAGDTLGRWRCLAQVAGHDLALLKLYEGHTDALAILAELRADTPPFASWGVWCAESPDTGLALRQSEAGQITLAGRKQWCSGAAVLSHALVSCRDADGAARLAAVNLRQPGVTVTGEGWHAVGMAATASVDVLFDDAAAIPVGAADAYLTRPGFWHGGAGIAACWYGAAQALAEYLHAAMRRATAADPHRLAHLGQVDTELTRAVALLRATAAAIDAANGAASSQQSAITALRLRLAVEAACSAVLAHVTRALGAAPLCRDQRFARLAADLPVFLRQSHAERDLAALGAMLAQQEAPPWAP